MAPRPREPGPDARVVPGATVRRFEDDRCGPGSLALVLSVHGDEVSEPDLAAALPDVAGRGVLSVDLLLAARQRGFDAALVAGTPERLRGEIEYERSVILMLRLFDAPGRRRDIYHYVVVDGADPRRRLFRFQFGDGQARWAPLESVEKGWRASAHALLVVWPRETTDAALRRAVALEDEGRLDDAAALYRQVLEVRPRSVRAWVDLGNAVQVELAGGDQLGDRADVLARSGPRRQALGKAEAGVHPGQGTGATGPGRRSRVSSAETTSSKLSHAR